MKSRLEQSRSHRLLTRYVQIPLSQRVGLLGLTFAAYAALILFMHESWDSGFAAWGVLVAILSGWLLGVWGGLLGGLLLIPLNIILFSILGANVYQLIWQSGNGWGPLTAVIAGVSVGWLQTMATRLEQELARRQRTEAALSESEEKYRSLIEQSNDAIYLLVNDKIEMINVRFEEMLGVGAAELAAPDFSLLDLVAPESRPLIDERGRKTTAGNNLSNQYEFVALTRDGRRLHLEASVSYPEFRGQTAVQGILRDVTERYEAQEALRQSEEKFRALIENALDVITVVDARGRILYESPSVERILGYKPEEMVGRNVLFFLHPKDRRASLEVFRAWLDGPPEGVGSVSFRLRNKQGEWRILEGAGRDLRDNPAVGGIVVNSRDVTERRLAQAGLRRRTAELEAMARVSGDLRQATNVAEIVPIILQQTRLLNSDILSAIFLLDPVAGDLVAYSRNEESGEPTSWRQPSDRGIAGHVLKTDEIYITGELSEDPLSVLYGHKTAVMHSNIFLPLRAQRRVSGALHVALREKRPFTPEEIRLLTAIAEITSSAIERAYVLETLEQRVTERTHALAQANERLQQLDRLKSKFVSDVSHELRTPVANLSLYLDLLGRGRAERRESYIAVLREQTERLTRLIEDILDLTRLEQNHINVPWELISLNDLAQQVFAAHVLRAQASGLRLRLAVEPELPPMLGNPNQIVQVITNLVTNALTYTPDGEVLLQTGCDLEKGRVWLKVTDSGLGIEADDILYLFDRFYRGKWASQSDLPGTGLGLAIVKEIMDLHGGQIDVLSQPGEGSTFTVYWSAAVSES